MIAMRKDESKAPENFMVLVYVRTNLVYKVGPSKFLTLSFHFYFILQKYSLTLLFICTRLQYSTKKEYCERFKVMKENAR